MCSKRNKRFKYVFNMITGINESKILTKHVSFKWKVIQNVIQIRIGIIINIDASVKSIIYVKKIIFKTLLHVVVKMVNI